MRHAGSSLNLRVYTDAGLLDLREPMRLLDTMDRMERRGWRRHEGGGGAPPFGSSRGWRGRVVEDHDQEGRNRPEQQGQ
jgi:hypothetical protein